MIKQVPENSNITILIVDDDPAQRRLMSALVSHGGYIAETAADEKEMLEKARLCDPDVILLDVYLPGINGIETCRRLKASAETRHIPVISVTGTIDRNVRIDCLEAGANDFISKPIDITELLIKIRNLIRLKEFENIKIKSALMAETFAAVERAKREWEESMDCISDVVILADANGLILRCNKMLNILTGKPFEKLARRNWREVMSQGGFSGNTDFSDSCEIFHESGKWFEYSFYDIESNRDVSSLVSVITLHDITESKKITGELLRGREMLKAKNEQLDEAYKNLTMTQSQMLQQEKMASIGQIAAGVAHEINNPMGFIISNFHSLKKYSVKITQFLEAQSSAFKECAESCGRTDALKTIDEMKRSLKIDHIILDLDNLISESLEGADRVKMIVQDLKSFSRVDEADHKYADINAGIESTINIIWNEIKYKTTIFKEYEDLPQIRCNPGQLNQVFLNLLVNAAHAIEKHGEIRVKTWHKDSRIFISVSDNGCGMPEEIKKRIFEPFFTTKEIGKGTGLGLSIAYDIIKKHNGELNVESSVGKGTTFTIIIPASELKKGCDGHGQ